jgi:hypothetical protein
MNRTFFVGVYPGIDDVRLDYVAETFGRFIAGARAVGGGVHATPQAPPDR